MNIGLFSCSRSIYCMLHAVALLIIRFNNWSIMFSLVRCNITDFLLLIVVHITILIHWCIPLRSCKIPPMSLDALYEHKTEVGRFYFDCCSGIIAAAIMHATIALHVSLSNFPINPQKWTSKWNTKTHSVGKTTRSVCRSTLGEQYFSVSTACAPNMQMKVCFTALFIAYLSTMWSASLIPTDVLFIV
jgi:hypothetical protein